MFLLRGNQDCRHLAEYFLFRLECEHKYSTEVYEACLESFNQLPLAALLNEQYLCVHGGIGPQLRTLKDIEEVCRVGLQYDLYA